MGSRTWALTGALIVVAAALGAWTATNLQARSNSLDHQEVADDLHAVVAARQERLDTRVADTEQTLTETQALVEELREYFAPRVLAAVSRVQANAVETACGQARSATRDGNPPPGAQAVIDLAVAATTSPALASLGDRWATFLHPAQVQTEIDSCAADEAAQIEAERQAAEAAAEAARLDRVPPCDPSQLTINSPVRGTYCVND